MKIVMLDRDSLGLDVDVSVFERLGEFSYHPVAEREKCKDWISDADVVIFNKTRMDEELLHEATKVKLLCITATGYDNIDLTYAKKRGIAVANVRNYSTPSVAQHTFALALYVLEKLGFYEEYVSSGAYSNQLGFSNFSEVFHELEGKTWGVAGLGNIGKKVARIAEAFGCRVIFYSTTGKNDSAEYERVDFETFLTESDVISIHCPLTEQTRNLFDLEAFRRMKKTAILVNVARGSIINEEDLYTALSQDMIGGAGLDVLSREPMDHNSPLGKIGDHRKLIITPHMAWAGFESRERCMTEVYRNIEAFIAGKERNRIDR